MFEEKKDGHLQSQLLRHFMFCPLNQVEYLIKNIREKAVRNEMSSILKKKFL